MPPIVRFAPSPTGHLHIGNGRSAILNWLFACKNRGQFILRFDDTDLSRSRQEYSASILQDLAWLGIRPALIEYQSKRQLLYDQAIEKLKRSGHLYPAYETADELDRKRKRQLANNQPPIYDRAALKLSSQEQEDYLKAGRKPHWRFKLQRKPISWHDLVRGPQTIDTATLSDPVLRREDGTYLYTLPSVVDDIDLCVTHVIRGEDHVVNTAVQIEISQALNAPPAHYAHYSLLVGADGHALSKRLGSLTLASMREAGLEAMAVASLAALIGTSTIIQPFLSYDGLVESFDLSHLSRAPGRFDEQELRQLNAKLLHKMPWDAVKDRLNFGDEDFWLSIRGNIETLHDANQWHKIIAGTISPIINAPDRDFIVQAALYLPPPPWNQDTWKDWTNELKNQLGRRGKELFMPLRLALTGLDSGPELANLLPLMGYDRVRARLSGV